MPSLERIWYLPSRGCSRCFRRKSVIGSPQYGHALNFESISDLQWMQKKGMGLDECGDYNCAAARALSAPSARCLPSALSVIGCRWPKAAGNVAQTLLSVPVLDNSCDR